MKGRHAVLALGLGLALLARAPASVAQGPAAGSPAVGTPEAIAAARAHFTRGRDLYQAGSYREAIVELDKARALDPKAKDLVFNLAIVHEKLAEIDEALRYARLYAVMDLDPAERTRAESYIKRLEGAKAEVLARKAKEVPAEPAAVPPPAERPRGRIDVATIVAAAVAVGAAAGGTILGVKALSDQPSNAVTGENGLTLQGYQNELNSAHALAVGADVCFGAAGAAAIVAGVLYFARYKDAPAPAASAPPQPAESSLTFAPLVGKSGGGLVFGGSF